MAEVTDPDLLRKLNAGAGRSSTEVTDPALLKRLNASRETQPSGWMDFIKSIPTGMVRGLGATAGASGAAEAGVMGMEGVAGPDQSERIMQRGVERRTGPLHEPAGLPGRIGASIGRAGVDPTTYLGPGGLVRKAITGATGAIGAELGGAMTNDSLLGRTAGGVIGGVAPAGVAGVARRAAAPAPMVKPQRGYSVGVLRREGIEPSAGDVSGRPNVRLLEEMSQRLGGGGRYPEIKEKPLRQLTQAVTARMGQRVEYATPEVIDQARKRIGNTLEKEAAKLPVYHDPRLTTELTAIGSEITSNYAALAPETAARIGRLMASINDSFITKTVRGRTIAVMSGKTYQNLTRHDTPLGRAMRSKDEDLSHYANKLRTALDNAVERTAHVRGTRAGTGRRGAWERIKEARKQWYNMLIISKAVAKAGDKASEGLILPEKLRQAMTSGEANKLAYAAGRSDLHRLARAANVVLTPERKLGGWERAGIHGIPAAAGFAGGLLAGHPVPFAMAGAGALPAAGRLAATGPGQAYLKRQRAPAQPTYPVAAAVRGGYQGRKQKKREQAKPGYGGTDADF